MFKGPLKRVDQEEQCAYLLIWVSNAGRDIFGSWGLSGEDSQNRFRDHTALNKKTVFARYVFQEMKQADESFDAFVTAFETWLRTATMVTQMRWWETKSSPGSSLKKSEKNC